jgi:hypothetical protein
MPGISNWFEQRKKRKQKQVYFEQTITSEEYKKFLEEVRISIADLVCKSKNPLKMAKVMNEETERWLKDMHFLHMASVKVGICWGITSFINGVYTEKTLPKKEEYLV